MKTIVIWEPHDIKGGVWYYKRGNVSDELDSRPDLSNKQTLDYLRTTAAMIGYNPVGLVTADRAITHGTGFTSVSLSDGNTLCYRTASDMAEMLNNRGYIPLPVDVLVKLLEYKNSH